MLPEALTFNLPEHRSVGRKPKHQIWHPRAVENTDPELDPFDSEYNLTKAANYFYSMATAEVKQFSKSLNGKTVKPKGMGFFIIHPVYWKGRLSTTI